MTAVAFFDTSFLETLPGRTIEPAVMDRGGGLHVVRGVLGRGVCDGYSLHTRAAFAK